MPVSFLDDEDPADGVEVGNVLHLDLSCPSRCLEGEGRFQRAGPPGGEVEHVRRPALDLPRCDDEAAGMGHVSLRDPDLPVDLGRSEHEVDAFLDADDAAGKVTHLGHVGKENRARNAGRKVRRREREAAVRPDRTDRAVDRAGTLGLALDPGIGVDDGQRIAVAGHLHGREAALPPHTDLVGALRRKAAGTGDGDLEAIVVTTSTIESRSKDSARRPAR
jgi:hypothetical protein